LFVNDKDPLSFIVGKTHRKDRPYSAVFFLEQKSDPLPK
jgi:hypothetical protein